MISLSTIFRSDGVPLTDNAHTSIQWNFFAIAQNDHTSIASDGPLVKTGQLRKCFSMFQYTFRTTWLTLIEPFTLNWQYEYWTPYNSCHLELATTGFSIHELIYLRTDFPQNQQSNKVNSNARMKLNLETAVHMTIQADTYCHQPANWKMLAVSASLFLCGRSAKSLAVRFYFKALSNPWCRISGFHYRSCNICHDFELCRKHLASTVLYLHPLGLRWSAWGNSQSNCRNWLL